MRTRWQICFLVIPVMSLMLQTACTHRDPDEPVIDTNDPSDCVLWYNKLVDLKNGDDDKAIECAESAFEVWEACEYESEKFGTNPCLCTLQQIGQMVCNEDWTNFENSCGCNSEYAHQVMSNHGYEINENGKYIGGDEV